MTIEFSVNWNMFRMTIFFVERNLNEPVLKKQQQKHYNFSSLLSSLFVSPKKFGGLENKNNNNSTIRRIRTKFAQPKKIEGLVFCIPQLWGGITTSECRQHPKSRQFRWVVLRELYARIGWLFLFCFIIYVYHPPLPL